MESWRHPSIFTVCVIYGYLQYSYICLIYGYLQCSYICLIYGYLHRPQSWLSPPPRYQCNSCPRNKQIVGSTLYCTVLSLYNFPMSETLPEC